MTTFLLKSINKCKRKGSNVSLLNLWINCKFSTINNLELVHVHTFHRHGDRTPWAPILTTKKEINFWKSKIAEQYYPKSAWNLCNVELASEITTWKEVASRLKTINISYKHDNWKISTPTIFTSSDNMDYNQWSRLRTYDSFSAPYLGQLTENGCKQLQLVGKKLRKRYIDELEYLPSIYDENVSGLHYNCTNMKRTIHSADNLVSQLYPMEFRKNNVLIPLYVDEREYTFLNPSTMRRVCPKLNIKGPNNLKNTIKSFDERFNELTQKVLNHYDVNEEDLRQSGYDVAFDSIYCKMAHGMDDMPLDFSDNDLVEFGKFMAKIHCGMMNYDRESLKLSWGNTVYCMMQLMKKYEGKFVISSCHDNSLLAVLCSIYGDKWKEMDLKWPFYGDFITFEVYKNVDSGSKYVKVLYNLENLNGFDGKEMILLEDLEYKWKDIMIDQDSYFNDACIC
eukprot:107233_1